jgi:hypothetical protein
VPLFLVTDNCRHFRQAGHITHLDQLTTEVEQDKVDARVGHD